MNELKFACPVCGQHITCDSSRSGSPMPCPTCFRQLVVPSVTAGGASNLVLTASEVSLRNTPLPSSGGAAARRGVPTKRFPWAALTLGLLACAAGAGAFHFRGKIIRAYQQVVRSETNSSSTGTMSGVGEERATPWTLNLAEAKIPTTPVAGRINGKSFTLERATVKGGMLILWRGPKWPPEEGMAVDFFAQRAEDLAGKTVIIEATRPQAPRLMVRWLDEQGQSVTQEFPAGYACRVEFDPLRDGRLAGKIYLAAPDEAKSYLAGTFDAEIH